MKAYTPLRTCNVAQGSTHVAIPMRMDCSSVGNAKQIVYKTDHENAAVAGGFFPARYTINPSRFHDPRSLKN